jgi:hypothetical protein
MAATLTASDFATRPLRKIEHGLYAQYFHWESNGLSMSAGDVFLMGYIPANVTVVDAYMWGGGCEAETYRVGNQTSTTAIAAATTLSAASTRLPVTPRTFSLSADAEGLHRIPIAMVKASGTSTATGSLNLLLILSADPII